jgi:hypothetical protein
MPIPRPLFGELEKHFPSNLDVSRVDLFRSIGWDDLLDNPSFIDTCAIRVSVGLIGAGVPVLGRMKIHKGAHKGKWIEPGQAKLSRWLARYWGPAEKFSTSELRLLQNRFGIISHFNITPTSPIAQGHIDVLSPLPGDLYRCLSMCHWTAAETWFWELPIGSQRATPIKHAATNAPAPTD